MYPSSGLTAPVTKDGVVALAEIADRYGLDLAGDWNVEVLPHQGSHSAEYHQVLGTMEAIDLEVDGDVQEFLKLFHERLMARSARYL